MHAGKKRCLDMDKWMYSTFGNNSYELRLNSTLCHWIFMFLTNLSQVVRMGGLTPDTLTISTGDPKAVH